MARNKIDFGIDLGTTNSALACFNNGTIEIIETETGKDTLPSCVYFNKKGQIFVGEKALNGYREESIQVLQDYKVYSAKKEHKREANSYIEFKRTMGTDEVYNSVNMHRSYSSEELSAEILKALRGFVKNEEVLSAVITVPAKFRQVQIDATLRAAEMAGLEYCELLQEQISASLAYGITSSTIKGYWLVFDFGGGTFDVALMRSEDGEMKVLDTEGDNHLGGKDIDLKIVDEIMIPYLKENFNLELKIKDLIFTRMLRDRLKILAEEAKIQLSSHEKVDIVSDEPICSDDQNDDMELDISLDRATFESKCKPIFQRTIDITLNLLKRNNLSTDEIEKLLLVGGPTYSPLLRAMLKEQICQNIDTSIDPMTAVARGAAIYASTRPMPENLQQKDTSKVNLIVQAPDTIEESLAPVQIKLAEGTPDNEYFLEISRKDKSWSSGRIELKNEGISLDVPLEASISNPFSIELYDAQGNRSFPFPESFTIIHGLKIARPTLPYDYGIAVANLKSFIDRSEILQAFEGTRKNVPLPAKGKMFFITQTDIEPGNAEDFLSVIIYEGEHGTKTLYNEFAGELTITGEDIDELLPAYSEIEISLTINESRKAELIVYLPSIDFTMDKVVEITTTKINPIELGSHIKNAYTTLENYKELFEEEIYNKFHSDLEEISKLFDIGKANRDTNEKVRERFREIMKEMDSILPTYNSKRLELMLNDSIEEANTLNDKDGDSESTGALKDLIANAEEAKASGNVNAIEEANTALRKFIYNYFYYYDREYWESIIAQYAYEFSEVEWTNSNRARKVLNEGISLSKRKDMFNEFRIKVQELQTLCVDPLYYMHSKVRTSIPTFSN